MAKKQRKINEDEQALPLDGLPEDGESLLNAEGAPEPEQVEVNLRDDHEFLKAVTESMLFSSREPLTEEQYNSVIGVRNRGKLPEFVRQLNIEYAQTGRAFEILHVAGGYQFFTKPDYSGALKKLSVERNRARVSRAALETLAVVAFRGPVTRIEIDDIRGVDSGGVLRTLLDRHLVAVKGRANIVGKPLLYETTAEFLKHFGLSSLTDLPRDSELTREWGRLQELGGRDTQTEFAADVDGGSAAAGIPPLADLSEVLPAAGRTNGHHHAHPPTDGDAAPDEGDSGQ
ncbi:SMC-Scp complex subunit ScpB [candidate division KSB1 bacterium]|nr:SMC-Scp complex subunit ScpB [candidate division KSB1 bacterium]